MKNRAAKAYSLNIIFTLLFLILSALFLIYIFRNIQTREYFDDPVYSWKYGEGNTCNGELNTNIELQNTNSAFLKNNYNRFDNTSVYNRDNLRNTAHPYRGYCDVMNYNDLLAYRCLKKSPQEIKTVLDRPAVAIANTIHHIFVYDEKSLYSFLASEIRKQKVRLDGDEKITGPVYVCISQAPYLKYNNAQTSITDKYLDARIDILNNKNAFYFENIDLTGKQDIKTSTDESGVISSLYCHILIIYPSHTMTTSTSTSGTGTFALKTDYNTKATREAGINTFLNTTMASFYTDNELCFLRCNKTSSLNCGCLTRTDTSPTANANTDLTKTDETIDMPSYPSKCIDHHIPGGRTPGNFSMMYYVNPYADNYTTLINDPSPTRNP